MSLAVKEATAATTSTRGLGVSILGCSEQHVLSNYYSGAAL
jgi:hypothetical protein